MCGSLVSLIVQSCTLGTVTLIFPFGKPLSEKKSVTLSNISLIVRNFAQATLLLIAALVRINCFSLSAITCIWLIRTCVIQLIVYMSVFSY